MGRSVSLPYGQTLIRIDEMAKRRDLPGLVRLLGDVPNADSRLRSAIARALGTTSDLHALEPLLALLQNRGEHRDVRLAAAEALGKVGDERVVPALEDTIRERSVPLTVSAIRGLGAVGRDEAVPRLLACLQDRKPTVRAAAAAALGNYPRDEVRHALAERLADPRRIVRIDAANAIARIGDAGSLARLEDATDRQGFLIRGIFVAAVERLRERLAESVPE